MNACELTTTITAIANAIACSTPDEELELLAAAFSMLGDTLETIAAQRNLCQSQKDAANSADQKVTVVI